jgi:ribonuclease J
MDKIDAWLDRTLDSDMATKKSSPQKKGGAQKAKPKSKGFFSRFKNKKRKGNNGENNQKQNSKPSKSHHKQKPQKNYKSQKPRHKNNKPKHKTKVGFNKGELRIIPIGGLNEVGKNMTAIEYENDIIIIDIGFEFPGDKLMGIDYIIPDVKYLEERKDRIKAIILTHGHLDHIGGLPYVLPKLDFPPLYTAKLTAKMIMHRAKEARQDKIIKMNVIKPDDTYKFGVFKVGFFRVMHSIPDTTGIIVDTPMGKVVHTADYKFDATPARNIQQAEIHKMEKLGKENVLALLSESTNAMKPGHTISEQTVGEALDRSVKNSQGRVIIASFSSQISRLQQIADVAQKYGRKVFVSGRSMRTNIEIALDTGYLIAPPGLFEDIKRFKEGSLPDNQVLVLTTGSQGEENAALTKMATLEHPQVKLKKGDTVVLSSSPIVGNERSVFSTINKLAMLGCEIVHSKMDDVHTSGHGNSQELAQMINYIKPKYLIPIHGEYYMRNALRKIAMSDCGMSEDDIIMCVNGSIVKGNIQRKGELSLSKEAASARQVLIDGDGEGYLDSFVQKEREMMSENGALVAIFNVSGKKKTLRGKPYLMSRGFLYSHEPIGELLNEMSELAAKFYRDFNAKRPGANRREIKKYLSRKLEDFARKKIKRKPLVLPVINEV